MWVKCSMFIRRKVPRNYFMWRGVSVREWATRTHTHTPNITIFLANNSLYGCNNHGWKVIKSFWLENLLKIFAPDLISISPSAWRYSLAFESFQRNCSMKWKCGWGTEWRFGEASRHQQRESSLHNLTQKKTSSHRHVAHIKGVWNSSVLHENLSYNIQQNFTE